MRAAPPGNANRYAPIGRFASAPEAHFVRLPRLGAGSRGERGGGISLKVLPVSGGIVFMIRFPLVRFVVAIFLAMLGFFASAARAETVEFRGATFRVYRFDPTAETLELFWRDESGKPYLTFQDLEKALNARGRRLKLALNAGIYEPGFKPSGLHISGGKTLHRLNRDDAPPKRSPNEFTPNFFLKPNGVFFVRRDGTAAVLETERYAKAGETPVLATQSGPLLLAKGAIHPAFGAASTSRLIRNGVGVDSKGRVVLACSIRAKGAGRINLHGFAELFRDRLDCRDALYLDGDISELYLRPEMDDAIPATNLFTGILAITEPVK